MRWTLFVLLVLLLSVVAQAEYSTEYNPENEVQGREKKAGNAEGAGNVGGVVAAVTGSAMLAAGTAMLSDLSPFNDGLGASLVTMGTQELLQSGADGSSSADNGGQKALLTNRYEVGKTNLPQSTVNYDKVLENPHLKNFLDSKGLDGKNFVDSMISSSEKDVSPVTAYENITGETLDDSQKDQAMIDNAVKGLGGAHDASQLVDSKEKAAPENSLDLTSNETIKQVASDSKDNFSQANNASSDSFFNPFLNLGGTQNYNKEGETASSVSTSLRVPEDVKGKGNIFIIASKANRDFDTHRKKPARVAFR